VGLALASVALIASQVLAQQKPAVVISVAGVKEQMADLRYVLQAAGVPQFAGVVDLMAAQYIQVLDADKPGGAAIWLADDGSPSVLGFLPVKDMNQLSTLIGQQLGPVQDAGNGVKILPAPQPIYMKQSGAYAFLSDRAENLSRLPQDPAVYLEGLDKKYNLAVVFNVQSVPAPLKEMALSFLEQAAEAAAQQAPDEAARELQEWSLKSTLEQYRKIFADGDQLFLGLSIDEQAKAVYIDFTLTAQPGSSLAGELSTLLDQSAFSGFLRPNAALAGAFASRITEAQGQQSQQVLGQLATWVRKQAENEIDDENARQLINDLVNQLGTIAEQTIASGTSEFGIVVDLEGESPRCVAGARVADGAAVQAIYDKLLKLAEEEAGVRVERDFYQGQSIRFHRVTAPAPDEEFRRIFGEELELGLGYGPNSAVITFGKGSIDLAKEVLTQPTQGAKPAINQLYISAAPILAYVKKLGGEFGENPALDAAQAALARYVHKDRVVIAFSPVRNGMQMRFSMDEGVIAAIGAAVAAATGGNQ